MYLIYAQILIKQEISAIRWRCSQTCEIRYRPHFVLISCSYQNPSSPNELLSKGYRFADIKASAEASHKTHACIALKQRSNSRNYGLVCYLGKQMADRGGFEPPTPRFVVRYSIQLSYRSTAERFSGASIILQQLMY